LTHEPVIHYLKAIIHGPLNAEEWLPGKRLQPPREKGFLPFWAIPIHGILSILLAIIVTKYFEIPVREN
jgi:hypothetical protein